MVSHAASAWLSGNFVMSEPSKVKEGRSKGGSAVRTPAALPENLGLMPSNHITVLNHQ